MDTSQNSNTAATRTGRSAAPWIVFSKMMNVAQPVDTPSETQPATPLYQKPPLNPASKISPLNAYANQSAPRAEEPSAVVRRYSESVNRHDLTQVYDCLSKSFKAHRPIDQFARSSPPLNRSRCGRCKKTAAMARRLLSRSRSLRWTRRTVRANGSAVSPLSKREMRGASTERNRQQNKRRLRSLTKEN